MYLAPSRSNETQLPIWKMHQQDSESEIGKSARKTHYCFEYNFTTAQRIIFIFTVSALLVFSLILNSATLVVAIRNGKVRPLFRSCLLSLALSDILFTLSSSVSYLTTFYSVLPQLWALGHHMCHIIPFSKLLSSVVNSLTLLTISMDRYLSVKCIARCAWEPGAKFCIFLFTSIWLSSTAIAVPSFWAYVYYPVFIVRTGGLPNRTEITAMIPGYMCGIPKMINARYYTGLFGILFIPMIVAFVWFNTFLAVDIWRRRNIFNPPAAYGPTQTQRNNNQDITLGGRYPSRPISSTSGSNSSFAESTTNRQKRQMRMFCVVLLLIITYMTLKLPEWIFLITSFYDDSVPDNPWIEKFAFGIISMGSSVTNPLLYAFVTQTMKYLQDMSGTVRNCSWLSCKRGVRVISNFFMVSTKSTSRQNASELAN